MYIIYKLNLKDDFYIGSTKNLNKRIYDHKDRSKQEKYKNYPLYKKMNECDFTYEILKTIDCDRKDALMHENNFINTLKPTLNQRRSGPPTKEEYRRENNARQKKYRENWTEEQKIEKRHKRNLRNKMKIRCEVCDCSITKSGLSIHNKSKKHQNNILKKNIL